MFGKEKKAEDKKKRNCFETGGKPEKKRVKHKKAKAKTGGQRKSFVSVRIRFGRSVGGMYSIRVCPKRRSPRDHRRYYDYFFDTGRIRNLFGNYRISGERTQLSDV